MSVATAKSILDGLLGIVSGPLAIFQSNYLSTSGGYWQGIQTPGVDFRTCPNNDTSGAIDLTRRPTDHPNTWVWATGTASSTLPGALAVDYYGGNLGQGYDIRLMVRDGTAGWIKVVSYGPESRTVGWTFLPSI